MGHGDFLPIGGHRKKPDPVRAKKIKEGGKIADAIHKQMEAEHHKKEVPAAENQLLSDLKNLNHHKQ